MRTSQIFIFFFINFNLFSQSGEIIYKAETIPFDYEKKMNTDSISETQKASLRAIFKNQLKVMYQLNFNINESYFDIQEKMDEDDRNLIFAKSKKGKGVYYTNIKENKIIKQRVYGGQEFLIQVPIFQWILDQESKKIGDYICYKATTVKYVEGRNGKIERKIIAWYTPQIPYNFGPKDYNGLPGLILELNENNLLIKATKISIKSKTQKIINKPNQGEKITLKAFDAFVKEMYYRRRKRN